MTKIKVTVFAIHRPNRAPNERYRWMQFYNVLSDKIDVQYLYLVNEQNDKILFQSNSNFKKILVYFFTFIKRFFQILKLKNTDVIIIFRELHWFHFPVWMLLLSKKAKKIIFDFDDAIFLPSQNFLINLIRQPKRKTIHFIKHSNLIIAGNEYLKTFAIKYNQNSIVIPTVVDTNYYKPLHHLRHQENSITIGWMGSHTTLQHLLMIAPVLKKIQQIYPFVKIKILASKTYIPELSIYSEDWKLENEIEILNTFDIGIMPIPDDEWSKGKCGLKLLTYLSCEIPAIASNVGVNPEIIQKTNGGIIVNNTDEEWIAALKELIENKDKRISMGKNGRKGVEEFYSLNKWKDTFFQCLMPANN
ncbi:MAG TPA: glycosyltransferase [Bacteroidia bacterium]|nr:glycosyltransferase [Bacteroidia bacterium]